MSWLRNSRDGTSYFSKKVNAPLPPRLYRSSRPSQGHHQAKMFFLLHSFVCDRSDYIIEIESKYKFFPHNFLVIFGASYDFPSSEFSKLDVDV